MDCKIGQNPDRSGTSCSGAWSWHDWHRWPWLAGWATASQQSCAASFAAELGLAGCQMPSLEDRIKHELSATAAQSLSSSCIAQGWLMKQGHLNKSASGWHRRWVVLFAHRHGLQVGGTQLLWYNSPDASTPNGVAQLFAPPAARRPPQTAAAELLQEARREAAPSAKVAQKNYDLKNQRKSGAAIGVPHCFRLELVKDKTRIVLAADTAAIADWWKATISAGAVPGPQPAQPTVLSLARVGMVWDTPVQMLLCEDTLVVRELGVPVMTFRYDAVVGFRCRSGSEIALYAKPDHGKHPLLFSGQNATHAQRLVAEVDAHLDVYAQQTAIPWMIERMKQKEADAAARAEERGEIPPRPPQPELQPEPEPPAGPRLLTLEQILDRGLGGGSGSTRDLLSGSPLPRGAYTDSADLAGSSLTRSMSRDPKDQQDFGGAHQQKLHRSTSAERTSAGAGMTTLAEIESEFEWMPEGWTTHYPPSEELLQSDDDDDADDPEPEPEPEPELESAVAASAPPASPVLGMPPAGAAPVPTQETAAAVDTDSMTNVAIGGTSGAAGGEGQEEGLDEHDEHYVELLTLARKGAQTTCAQMFKVNTSQLRMTVANFCEEIQRRAERQHRRYPRTATAAAALGTPAGGADATHTGGGGGGGHGGGRMEKGPSKEEAADCSTILRDVSAFLEAMCAHVCAAQHDRLHSAVSLALKSRPGTLRPDAIEAAIQTGVEWHIGGVVYSKMQKVLLATAGTTRAGPQHGSEPLTAAELDARLLEQRSLLGDKPQRFLEIDPTLISRTEWRKAREALSKINGSTIQGTYATIDKHYGLLRLARS